MNPATPAPEPPKEVPQPPPTPPVARKKRWRSNLDVGEKILTSLAIVAGALWFILKAEGFPKAKCSHQLITASMPGSSNQIHWGCIKIRIENIGERPLKPAEAIVKISQILPLDDTNIPPIEADDRVHWPQLYYKRTPLTDIVIYPGEADSQNFEFYMTNIQAFRVYSFISLTSKASAGWTESTCYSVGPDGKITPLESAGNKKE